MNIILIGPPGAGKGTQAARLEKVMKLPHIASGDIFREIRRQDTPEALEVREYMDRGGYVPDDLTIRSVLARLDRPDAKNGFLLDGFPRTEPQAEALDQALEDDGRAVELVLYLKAPLELLMARVADRIICPQCSAIYNLVTKPPVFGNTCDNCGHTLERRTDETPETFRERWRVYLEETKPLVGFYKNQGILVEIDGTQPLSEVEMQVDEALGVKEAR